MTTSYTRAIGAPSKKMETLSHLKHFAITYFFPVWDCLQICCLAKLNSIQKLSQENLRGIKTHSITLFKFRRNILSRNGLCFTVFQLYLSHWQRSLLKQHRQTRVHVLTVYNHKIPNFLFFKTENWGSRLQNPWFPQVSKQASSPFNDQMTTLRISFPPLHLLEMPQ